MFPAKEESHVSLRVTIEIYRSTVIPGESDEYAIKHKDTRKNEQFTLAINTEERGLPAELQLGIIRQFMSELENLNKQLERDYLRENHATVESQGKN